VSAVLEFSDVVRYLLARGAVSRETVVDADLVVRDMSSRNRNFRVEISSGTGFHLKQGSDSNTRVAVAHEAAVYREVRQRNPRFAEFMPFLQDFDDGTGVLLLRLIRDAEDLRAYHLRTKQFPTDLGATIGEALALLHMLTPPACEADYPCPYPSFFNLYRPRLEIFRSASAANLQLIRIVQSSSDFCQRLDVLRERLRREALLHNDLKWDNMLLSPEGLRLVDWETAEFGDPAWDLGSVFGQYLSWWIFSMPVSGGKPPDNFADLAAFPLASMKPALNACWTAYFSTRSLASSESSQLLLRAVAMTGVRLMQSAFEASQFATHLTSSDILHIQLASNIVERPVDACRHLLGLPIRNVK
jgi:hypothetical protein